jgi:hypothetical protein
MTRLPAGSCAGRAEHAAYHRHRQLVLHGYLGRFAGGICSPLLGRRPEDLVRRLGVQENRERWRALPCRSRRVWAGPKLGAVKVTSGQGNDGSTSYRMVWTALQSVSSVVVSISRPNASQAAP